jgi:uncharacterized protein DUF5916/cellulose/xylan binding protein with CBM9 domain
MAERTLAVGVLALCLIAPAASAVAQSPESPAAPVPPDMIVRDTATGKTTVRITRLASPLKIDGRLDEAFYETVRSISDFIQMEPAGGQQATEKTEVWLAFDQRNVYVSMRVWESQPERMVVNEMRRDSNNIRQGESIGFGFDTFYDHRNAIQFEVNPLGARTDGQSVNERQYSADWNPVWDLAVDKFEGGWTLETAVPFKSIRYGPGREQVWGFQARRTNKWKNEISFLTEVPPAYGLGRGSFSASLFATMVGLEAPPGSKNFEAKPYGIANLTTDNTVSPRISDHPDADFGADAKYGLTQNLTADLTYNTDFAQVEADEQQINLTRFSLFFPEKRDFFLENQGTFSFGGAGGMTGASAGGDAGETPILFYSRRIGFSQNHEVPIWGGGRMTGRVGRTTIGLLNITTREDDAARVDDTNFSVVRIKQDVLRRSAVGVIMTARSIAQSGRGTNEAAGVDGTFQFFNNLAVNTYFAKTWSEGVETDDLSYRAQLDYGGDRYGVQLERLAVGDNFIPDVGYLRRDDIRRNYALFRFSPRPKSIRSVRKFSGIGALTYTENSAGRLETRIQDGEFGIEFQNSDRFLIGINNDYEYVKQAFAIVPKLIIPVGGYEFATGRIGYVFGQQRWYSGGLIFEAGGFYEGTRKAITFNRARLNFSSQFSIEPSVSINAIDLPQGSVTTKLVGSRITYTITPMMFVSAFVQYNSSTNTMATNARLRWEYRPGSELFIVYNDERDTLTSGFPGTRNRGLIFKINRLFRL